MAETQTAYLNGLATSSMQDMLRKGELFKLPSSLSSFIANKGWEAVEYIEPESQTTKVAHFDGLMDWVTASIVRGGLGSRIDKVVKLISQPMDATAAPECCTQLLDVLKGRDAQALAPMIAAAAAANAKLTGDKGWRKLADKADAAVQNPHGGDRSKLYNVQVENKAPTGNSTAAGLRKLRRYADSESLCQQNGIDQANVTEQYGKTLRGEKSVHRALIDSGLKKKQVKSLWIGDPATMAQRIVDGMGRDKAAELITHLTTLLTDD
jgi:hypothetical protein